MIPKIRRLRAGRVIQLGGTLALCFELAAEPHAQKHRNRNSLMIDAFKNIGNLGALMSRAKEMQEKMKGMQEELAKKQISADAGGGMVTATVNGRLELVKLHIDKTKIDPTDTEMLEDLTVAAVSAAQTKAAQMMHSEMGKLAAELGLPPGMLPQ
jgi:DNA-binding YbaB/EbfC family protein